MPILTPMRLKLGRPDLTKQADRFDVPEAAGDLAVTFLGVALHLPTIWRPEDPWSDL